MAGGQLDITATARLPTRHGEFSLDSFRYGDDPVPHLALSVGRLNGEATPLVRVHSECATGELFGSLRCDCAAQLDESLRRIHAAGCGVLVYLRQEGRGIGIENKLKAYALQDQGLDTVEANIALGLPVDARSFAPGVAYLQERGVTRCQLLTNNPEKVKALVDAGIEVTRVPLKTPGQEHSHPYMEAKRLRLGHDL